MKSLIIYASFVISALLFVSCGTSNNEVTPTGSSISKASITETNSSNTKSSATPTKVTSIPNTSYPLVALRNSTTASNYIKSIFINYPKITGIFFDAGNNKYFGITETIPEKTTKIILVTTSSTSRKDMYYFPIAPKVAPSGAGASSSMTSVPNTTPGDFISALLAFLFD